ncbi:MAG: hypothetical protein HKO85_08075 [Xanthomonadales bacterium]|nr:hypothetical protein [Gammaproteobacteria bacterium]NNL05234.1 hypothetical protein [Xanthomonadales bacterium]
MKQVLALALLAVLLLTACSSKPRVTESPSVEFNIEGIVIWNRLNYAVRDVMIEVPASGRFAGCGNILPRSKCQTSFPVQRYTGNAIQVRWSEHAAPHSTEPFTVEPPEAAAQGSVFWLQIEVFAPGQAGATLVQP